MIDLHCHLIPGVDDGAPDMAESVAMCRALVAHGFSGAAPSPHRGRGVGGDVSMVDAAKGLEALRTRLREESIPLQLWPNAEHHIDNLLPQRMDAGEVIPMGGGRWMLVELPWHPLPDPDLAINALLDRGARLVMAHPERYRDVVPSDVMRWTARGVLMQCELGSFVGVYGPRAQKHAEQLLDRGLVHLLASDLHRAEQADKWLQRALDTVADRVGDDALQRLLWSTPKYLLGIRGPVAMPTLSREPVERLPGALRGA